MDPFAIRLEISIPKMRLEILSYILKFDLILETWLVREEHQTATIRKVTRIFSNGACSNKIGHM